MFETKIKTMFFKILDNIEYGELCVICPDNQHYVFQGKQPGTSAQLKLFNWKVAANVAIRGDIGFAEDYRDQLWDTPDLTALLTFSLENDETLSQFVDGSRLSQIFSSLQYLLNQNTLRGSKKNIHKHYDIGNDFYKLWLDQSMTYSSAIFKNPDQPLLEAQHVKYDRIIDQIETNSGRLLEIGCGWGGFAERALDQGDYAIKGITLSEQQHRYATNRLSDKQSNADISIQDYRHEDGKYDNIVSIEMFEAVGERYWPEYFNKLASLLSQSGKALLQTIVIHERCFEQYRRGADMIRTFIFPGGMLPSPTRFEQEASNAGLQVSNKHFFGHDYALTLTHWLNNFDAKTWELLSMGFDQKFIRIWRFYFAACIASFMVNRTSVMQVQLSHA